MSTVIVHENSHPDRGKGVLSFDEMMDFALVEVDFDDPTINMHNVVLSDR